MYGKSKGDKYAEAVVFCNACGIDEMHIPVKRCKLLGPSPTGSDKESVDDDVVIIDAQT